MCGDTLSGRNGDGGGATRVGTAAGAGGGGYLALVVNDAKAFIASHPEAIELKIRRE